MVRISIIIPVYNVEKYLRKCIDSVINQSYPLYEIILIDDGSTDSCPQICDEYANIYSDKVRVIHQENRGLSGARNRGIESATGDYLGFIDSDDYIDPDMFSNLATLIEDSGADMAVGGGWVEYENGKRYSWFETCEDKIWSCEEALVELNSYRYIGISACNKLFSKKLFRNLSFPPVLYEDTFVMYKLVAACDKVVFTSLPLYHYVQRYGSISRNSNEISLLPLEAYRQQLAFFIEKFPNVVYAAEAAYVFAHIAIYNLYVRKGLKCERLLTGMLQREARKYIGSVIRNRHLPMTKIMQAVVFCISLSAYRVIIKRKDHR